MLVLDRAPDGWIGFALEAFFEGVTTPLTWVSIVSYWLRAVVGGSDILEWSSTDCEISSAPLLPG